MFQLQILGHETYSAQAASEHAVVKDLPPERGEIFLQDSINGKLFPAAINRDTYTVYVEPNRIINKEEVANGLAEILAQDEEEIFEKLTLNDPYEPIAKKITEDLAQRILQRKFVGVGFLREPRRFYPERNMLAHITGFVGQDDKGTAGKYGIEGFYDKELAGHGGYFRGEKDALGRLIRAGGLEKELPLDGDSIVLTIDRTIQFFVCTKLEEYIKKFDASGGTVIVMNPKTGAIFAMCSFPNFDPNEYNSVNNFSVYTNPAIFEPYEPGSIFEPITMAAGLDSGKIEPSSTYEDKGVVKIGSHEIQNSDLEAHGVQTMTQVLEKSLNTGVVYVVRQIGRELFRTYVENFGFGSLIGIPLDSEAAGDISNLGRRGEIYAATASFGQGITATPLQIVTAFGTIANGGNLMKPFIVQEIRKSSGEIIKSVPQLIRQVISEHTATLLGSMMTAVVENGHGKRAAVPGYFVAGKTGTAQIPHPGGGYYKDATIGSFVGFAPTTNPRFVMITKIVRPQSVQWAESTAAPLFGEIAKFLLNYFEVQPERNNE